MAVLGRDLRRQIWLRDRGECHWCGKRTVLEGSEKLANLGTVDHLFSRLDPRRYAGNVPLVLACHACNQFRGQVDGMVRVRRMEKAMKAARRMFLLIGPNAVGAAQLMRHYSPAPPGLWENFTQPALC